MGFSPHLALSLAGSLSTQAPVEQPASVNTSIPKEEKKHAPPQQKTHLQTSHVSVSHSSDRAVVTIELTESAVVFLYLSGCALFIGGLGLGCVLWQRAQKHEPCACHSCLGVYRHKKSIAKGGFGEAALVVRGGRNYVMKKIGCQSINAANRALQEAACLQRLHHPGVVEFMDVFLHRHDNGGCSVQIVMEYCAGGDLIDRLECRRDEAPLTERQVLAFFELLCRALHHVHACGILHRDLKSSNIFVTLHDRAVKLGDFGLAASGMSRRRLSASPRRMSQCGTRMYMSPEVAAHKPYGAASDVYGLGCVLLECLLRRQLSEPKRYEARTAYIKAALGRAAGHGWEAFDTLAALTWRMLDSNPKTRAGLPDAADAAAAAAAALSATNGRPGAATAKAKPPAAADSTAPTAGAQPITQAAVAKLARRKKKPLLAK